MLFGLSYISLPPVANVFCLHLLPEVVFELVAQESLENFVSDEEDGERGAQTIGLLCQYGLRVGDGVSFVELEVYHEDSVFIWCILRQSIQPFQNLEVFIDFLLASDGQ